MIGKCVKLFRGSGLEPGADSLRSRGLVLAPKVFRVFAALLQRSAGMLQGLLRHGAVVTGYNNDWTRTELFYMTIYPTAVETNSSPVRSLHYRYCTIIYHTRTHCL